MHTLAAWRIYEDIVVSRGPTQVHTHEEFIEVQGVMVYLRRGPTQVHTHEEFIEVQELSIS